MKNIINTAVETNRCVRSICALNKYKMVKMTELKGGGERFFFFFFFCGSHLKFQVKKIHIQGMFRKERSNQINRKMVRDNVRYSIHADSATSVLLKSLISVNAGHV